MEIKQCDTCNGPAKFGKDVPPPERGATVIKFSGKLGDPNAKPGPPTVKCATCIATNRVPVQGRGL